MYVRVGRERQQQMSGTTTTRTVIVSYRVYTTGTRERLEDGIRDTVRNLGGTVVDSGFFFLPLPGTRDITARFDTVSDAQEFVCQITAMSPEYTYQYKVF